MGWGSEWGSGRGGIGSLLQATTRALMLFKGADGAPYEVRGEAGSVFNILSSPRLSVNSQFVAVPPQFPVCPPANAHAHAPLTPRVWWADAGRGRHCAG